MCNVAAMFMAAVTVAACRGNKGVSHANECDTTIVVNSDSATADYYSDDNYNADDDNYVFVLRHVGVDKNKIMPYVTCSGQAVDSLLAIADTVYSKTSTYQLKSLDMGTDDMNSSLQQDYKDTVQVVVALFDSYSRMLGTGLDEANASLVWHEVATMQMKKFCVQTGGRWQGAKSRETIFGTIEQMMWFYGGGSQGDMNSAAWCMVMPATYRLMDACKQLDDLCRDAAVRQLVHADYMHTLKTYRDYRASLDEWYSDLPREQGELFRLILEAKLEFVQRLVDSRKKGRVDNSFVKKSMREHRLIWFGKDMKLSVRMLASVRDKTAL